MVGDIAKALHRYKKGAKHQTFLDEYGVEEVEEDGER